MDNQIKAIDYILGLLLLLLSLFLAIIAVIIA